MTRPALTHHCRQRWSLPRVQASRFSGFAVFIGALCTCSDCSKKRVHFPITLLNGRFQSNALVLVLYEHSCFSWFKTSLYFETRCVFVQLGYSLQSSLVRPSTLCKVAIASLSYAISAPKRHQHSIPLSILTLT